MRNNSAYTGHPIYILWRSIKNRCYCKSAGNYHRYGGKGVVVCGEWKNDFMCFYNWCNNNGWRKGLQIDKDIKAKVLGVEPNLYSPERCQFVSSKINNNARSNNRIIKYEGMSKTLQEWSFYLGIKHRTLRNRLGRKWTIERTFKTCQRKYEKCQ